METREIVLYCIVTKLRHHTKYKTMLQKAGLADITKYTVLKIAGRPLSEGVVQKKKSGMKEGMKRRRRRKKRRRKKKIEVLVGGSSNDMKP